MELSILVEPDGSVTFPSLANELVPIARSLDPSFSVAVVADALPSARYLATKRIEVPAAAPLSELSLGELWDWHARTRTTAPSREQTRASRLDLKIEIATRLLRSCALCPWDCRIDRMTGQTGFCGLGRDAYYTNEFLHFGEEAAIRPSHTVFLTGCSLRCVYCATGDSVVRPRQGTLLRPGEMAARIAARAQQGARSVSFVGGNPDQNLLPILETLRACDTDLPVVWNSNLYAAPAVMELLDGVVDIHVADLKYGTDACAHRASGIPRYWETVTANLERAAADAHMIVRHLVLPAHGICCTAPVLRWLAERLPGVPVNLMAQYRPDHLVAAGRHEALRRAVTVGEIDAARTLATRLGIPVVETRSLPSAPDGVPA